MKMPWDRKPISPSRKPTPDAKRPGRRSSRPSLEPLEGRQLLAWNPLQIPSHLQLSSPVNAAFYSNVLRGTGAIQSQNDLKYTAFVAPRTGNYTFDMTPQQNSQMHPIFAVYNASGNALGYPRYSNADAKDTLYLVQGQRYYFEKTNQVGSQVGGYNWSITGPGWYSGTASTFRTDGEAHLVGNTLTVHIIDAFGLPNEGRYDHTITVQLIGNDGLPLTTQPYTGSVATDGSWFSGLPTSTSDRTWSYDVSNINLSNFNHILVTVS